MSTDDHGAVSRPSNGTNSVNGDSGGESGSTAVGGGRPTVGERVAEFEEEYPELAGTRLSEVDGRKLRRELTEADRVRYNVDLKHGSGTVTRHEEVERRALTWAAAVEAFLDAHEDYRHARMRFGKGAPGSPEREEFDVSLTDAWGEAYADREYAKAKAIERETAAEWGDCTTVMLTFTASSVPGGNRLPPIDHLRGILDTWSDYVYHELRNTMRSLGFERDEWMFWVQGEPHPGDGDNACYGHVHVGVYVDGEVSEADFHSVIDKHVEKCGPARREAHDYDTAISVNGDVEHIGSYMAAYAGAYGDELLERPIEYLAWGALHWATNSQRTRRSGTANSAITADACRQRYEDPDTGQDHDHAKRLRRDGGRGPDIVCAACGSSWGVPEAETLVEARLSEPDGSETGELPGGASDGERDPEGELRSRWRDADGAVSVGERPTVRKRRERAEEYLERNPGASVPEVMGALGLPPSARSVVGEVVDGVDPPGTVSFERAPKWRAESVIRGQGEDAEEYPVRRAGGVDLVPLKLPMKGGSSLWDRPPGVTFRCGRCRFGTKSVKLMKRHAPDCASDGGGGVSDLAEVVEYDYMGSGTPG